MEPPMVQIVNKIKDNKGAIFIFDDLNLANLLSFLPKEVLFNSHDDSEREVKEQTQEGQKENNSDSNVIRLIDAIIGQLQKYSREIEEVNFYTDILKIINYFCKHYKNYSFIFILKDADADLGKRYKESLDKITEKLDCNRQLQSEESTKIEFIFYQNPKNNTNRQEFDSKYGNSRNKLALLLRNYPIFLFSYANDGFPDSYLFDLDNNNRNIYIISEENTSRDPYENHIRIRIDIKSFLKDLLMEFLYNELMVKSEDKKLESIISQPDPRDDIGRKYYEFFMDLGQVIGIIFKYLPERKKVEVLKKGRKIASFGQGLGVGLGERIYDFCDDIDEIKYSNRKNYKFAIGLGIGVSSILKKLDEDCMMKIIQMAEESDLFAHNIREELKYQIIELNDALKLKILELSKIRPELSSEIGYGFGRAYDKLDKKILDTLQEYLSADNEFSEGFGVGIGTIYKNLSESQRKEVWENVDRKLLFQIGFGLGIGTVFHSLQEDLKNYLLDLPIKYFRLTSNLGYGVGQDFYELDESWKEKVLNYAKKNSIFARSFGEGIGKIFKRLNIHWKKEILNAGKENIYMLRWLGNSVADDFEKFDDSFKHEILELSFKEDQYAFNLGSGLASYFLKFDDFWKGQVFDLIKSNKDFAEGFFTGFNDISRLDDNWKNRFLELFQVGKFGLSDLSKSLGRAFSKMDNKWREIILVKIFQDSKNLSYFGIGLRNSFASLDLEWKIRFLNIAMENEKFADSLVDILEEDFNKYSDEIKEMILILIDKYKKFP